MEDEEAARGLDRVAGGVDRVAVRLRVGLGALEAGAADANSEARVKLAPAQPGQAGRTSAVVISKT